MKVLNYGSLNYDYVYEVIISTNREKLRAVRQGMCFCGGKGLNQSVALARAGVLVYQGGLIGEDGQLFLDICRKTELTHLILEERRDPVDMQSFSWIKRGKTAL